MENKDTQIANTSQGMSTVSAKKRKVQFADAEPDKKLKCKNPDDSEDEEDSEEEEERNNVMHEDDIEGEEDGISDVQDEIKITPFNMKEELEEGHFDRDGHFQWDKDKEIRDNWLDNIDWIKIKTNKNYLDRTNRGLADSSDSEDDDESKSRKNFNQYETYKKLFGYMKPGETVKRTLQRLGKTTKKLSSTEKWKRKKAGITDDDDNNRENVIKFTQLADEILTHMGNMDIYEETYEVIQMKLRHHEKTNEKNNVELDMYADDFDSKEKLKLNTNNVENKLKDNNSSSSIIAQNEDNATTSSVSEKTFSDEKEILQWEFKWKQEDTKIYGPFTTEQMQQWVYEEYFKDGVFVRKVGESKNFYSSNRIDFELYL